LVLFFKKEHFYFLRVNTQYTGLRPAARAFVSYRVGGQPCGRWCFGSAPVKKS
jgi:hypothetical protein